MKDNDLTDGISGRVGNKLVFRTTKGVTIATRRPKPTETPVTAKQTAHRENFKRAASYAKKKLLDPVAKEEYLQMAGDKAFRNAFSEAVRDYLVAPGIESIDVSGFIGAAGKTKSDGSAKILPYTFERACSKSAIKSSTSSTPILKRMRESLNPFLRRSSLGMLA
jgi:hypothetical protein